ncbi:MAG: hypothetical protein V4492_05485 [Chlamydiota bacterium]
MSSFSSVSSLLPRRRTSHPNAENVAGKFVKATHAVFGNALKEIRKLNKAGEPRLFATPMLEGTLELLGKTAAMNNELALECGYTAAYLTVFHAKKYDGTNVSNPHALSKKTYQQVSKLLTAFEVYLS